MHVSDTVSPSNAPWGETIFEAGYFYHFGRVPVLQENPKLSTVPSSFFITSVQSAETQKWDLQKRERFWEEQFSHLEQQGLTYFKIHCGHFTWRGAFYRKRMLLNINSTWHKRNMTHEFSRGTKTCRLIFPMLILAEYQLHFGWSHIAEWYIIQKCDVWPCKLMQTAFIFSPLKTLLAAGLLGGISNQHPKLYVLRQPLDSLSLWKWKTWLHMQVQLSVNLITGERTFCTCLYFWSLEGYIYIKIIALPLFLCIQYLHILP